MEFILKRRKFSIYFILIGLFLFELPGIACAGDIVAIVNKGNGVSALTLKELTNLYKGKTKQWSSGEGVVLFLPDASSKAMQALATNVFKKKNSLGVSKFYLKAVFQQKFASPPQKVASTGEAVDSVSGEIGGIAVVSDGEITDKSVIKVISVGGL